VALRVQEKAAVKSSMDPRMFLRLPLGQTSSAVQYFVDGRAKMTASQLTSSTHYCTPYHYYQHHHHQQQQQQQCHWDAMLSVWNAPTVASHDRKLFSIDSILNLGDTWRTDRESISRLETSDLSGKL